MSRVAYVNGRYEPLAAAKVSIDDRAFTFGDGVYEVCEVRNGALIEETRHLKRLGRSLAAVRIAWPMSETALKMVMREVVRRNRVRDGFVYLQVSRGAARRDHGFPDGEVKPGVVVSARALDPAIVAARAAAGVAVITLTEERWAHPHIKTLQLLPNVLAKQAAREAGAFEAWFVDQMGYVTEGASTNAWIVTREGKLVTRRADNSILHGVTRAAHFDVAKALGLGFEERPFTVEEALGATEAFLTSATTVAIPVTKIDGKPVGAGLPGPTVSALRRAFHDIAEKSRTIA
ncbi:MAG TPA: D-amino-acid transaminase [Roseiarcus sp.]|nr:D-amino-acid transaminase [Roseiarcus sp.]